MGAPRSTIPTKRFSPASEGLTPAMREAFAADGYLVIEKFVSSSACDRLRERAMELIDAFDIEEHRTIFSTKTRAHAASRYFQESGGAIRFFFEELAFREDGRLRQDKALSINKIGHALHDLDPVFSDFSRSTAVRSVAGNIPISDPRLLQSMYIFKQPRIGGEVVWHVDSTYLYTDPPSCVGFWFALEDATLENGAMVCLPGTHRKPLKSRFVRRGGELTTIELDNTPWPSGPVASLEAPKGTLVLLHGNLPHRSGPNLSDKSRHAYTLHVIDGVAEYPDDNWLQRPRDLPMRGF